MLQIRWMLVLAALLVALVGCDAGSSAPTLDAHEVSVPGGVEERLPFPEQAEVINALERGGEHHILFRPNMVYSDAVAFFSAYLPASGWNLLEESVDTDEPGERDATWTAEGHGVALRVHVTTYGGRQSTNSTGSVVVAALDEAP